MAGKARRSKTPLMAGIAAAVVGLTVLMAVFAVPRLERYFLIRAADEQAATLRLAVEGLRLTLERYAPIPALIAARPEIGALVADPTNQALRTRAESLLAETAVALRATGVYLENRFGTPIAAVPQLAPDGADRATYRPYFGDAVAGGLGQYYALGTQSGERGFFYAAPVRIDGRIKGVVAIKFAVDQFEGAWREGTAEIIVRDSNDIVFMSSRPDWNFRAMIPLSAQKRLQIEAAQQFPVDQIQPLQNTVRVLNDRYSVIEVTSEEGTGSFVISTRLIARAGWRVSILTPTAGAYALARTTGALLLLTVLLAALIGALWWQRRARLNERMAAQRAAQEMLEARVSERTAELHLANRQLVDEVAERRATEERLKQTQAELVQAAKLAGLGQMSAALSHELNQPLTAVKAYAENALAYMERARGAEAADNVRQISVLADRMSSIAKHLRNFARRPQDQSKAVPLLAIIDDALAVMQPKIAEAGATIIFDRSKADLWVNGGPVRLQQVVVNLISNALDATSAQSASNEGFEPTVWIEVSSGAGQVHMDVSDNGPGIAENALKTLFDPFFTTKEPGRGLGLGLSISYNIVRDFKGQLSAHNHDKGGAVFRMSLIQQAAEQAEPQSVAAQ